MEISPEQFFQALAQATRLRCLALLVTEGELCVCELTYALRLSQPMISRHLATLRELGIVTDRRQGQWVYYRLNPDLAPWQHGALDGVVASTHENAPFADDLARLRDMPNRPGATCCA